MADPQTPDLQPLVDDAHAAVTALTAATSGNPDAAVGAVQPLIDVLSRAWAALKGAYDASNAAAAKEAAPAAE
jgi:hypothetical protein